MNKFEKPVYVTKPFMPPFEEFCLGLKEIWDNQWLTNNGPVLQRYCEALKIYFGTDNLCLFANGTLALQIALQGLGIRGEVITTPFTFVATAHALHWTKVRPVFCDIEPDFFTLDPAKIEALITPWTTAILAVHVFGRPCKVDALADIARRHNLVLIYDAAHAFGVKVNGKSICHFGDVSMFSFHATKIYHSIEGGMLVSKDPGLCTTFNYLKNYGFKSETEVVMPGTNAKMNEIQALMGSMVLKHIDSMIAVRRELYETYTGQLAHVPGISFSPPPEPGLAYNYAYFTVLIDEKEFGMDRDRLYTELKGYNIFTRRYFYPLINELACYRSISVRQPLVTAARVSSTILALPIYHDLGKASVGLICDIIKALQKKS
ncbi:MAG: DegT/DnrJ/EryC1/StrS family aminotransferase [Pseudomonadota bacterium]